MRVIDFVEAKKYNETIRKDSIELQANFFRVCGDKVAFTNRVLQEFNANPSANLPYHNNLHQMTVALMCLILSEQNNVSSVAINTLLSKPNCYFCHKEILFAAAMFHDYGHSGGTKPDFLNIHETRKVIDSLYNTTRAIDIHKIIRVTEYPFEIEPKTEDEKIIRDADILCSLLYSDALFYEQYVVGLKAEIEVSTGQNISTLQFCEAQINFLRGIKFYIAKDAIIKEFEEKIIGRYEKWVKELTEHD